MATFPVISGLVRKRKNYKERKITLHSDYRTLYRFDESNVEWISSHFLGESQETRGGALSSKQQLQIFLRYIPDPGFQSGVAEDLGVGQSTVCKTIHKVQERLLAKVHIWIKFPSSNAELTKAKEIWQEKFNIPCVIGAIDCTHVRITKPSINGDEYINRKRYTSYNIQATCNAKEIFTSVDAKWPGSVHDSRIFKNSDICRFLKEKTNDTILLGDSGYGIAPWLITPYDDPTTAVEKHFNKIYAKERVIIERCFGQLKRRFPILHYKVRVSTKNVSGIVICCFLLHNVAKYLKDEDDFPELPEENGPLEVNSPELNDTVIKRTKLQR